MRSVRQRGLTLMEVLIAVSLVGLMSIGILMSIRMGLNAMDKTNKRLMANRRLLGAQRILERLCQRRNDAGVDRADGRGEDQAAGRFLAGERGAGKQDREQQAPHGRPPG